MGRLFNIVVLALFVLVAAGSARAQVASSAPPPPGSTLGWSFAVTPYVWPSTISTSLQASGPRGGTVGTTITSPFRDYLTYINFAAMFGAEARYDRVSVITDFQYSSLSITTSASRLSSVNIGSGPIDIPRSRQVETGTRMAMTVWSMAGGYTLLQGDWGNIDAIAGFRMLAVNATTNYSLTTNILAPDGTIALSRGDSLNPASTYFNAIGGVTGRINIPNSKFYVPFYFDAGGGALPLTWQAYGGVAYGAADWVDVSIGYRYLAFENRSSGTVRSLSLGGGILAVNFRF